MIDPALLPRRALIDSSVLVAALDESIKEAAAQDCRDFWVAMLTNGNEIVIASPTIAEFVTRRDFGKVPRVRGVSVVGFDLEAARLFGEKFPPSVLREERTASGGSKASIKFDAMIVACAVRHRVEHFISLDGGQRKLAAKVGLKAKQPSEFVKMDLFMSYTRGLEPTTPRALPPAAPPAGGDPDPEKE